MIFLIADISPSLPLPLRTGDHHKLGAGDEEREIRKNGDSNTFPGQNPVKRLTFLSVFKAVGFAEVFC